MVRSNPQTPQREDCSRLLHSGPLEINSEAIVHPQQQTRSILECLLPLHCLAYQ